MYNIPIQEDQIIRRGSDGYLIGLNCIKCAQETQVHLTGSEMFRIQTSDEHIQKIIPNKPADIREMFISGLCGKCFDDMFDETGDYDE